MDYAKNRNIRKSRNWVALDTHMMHVTIGYLFQIILTQLFTALDEGSVNVDMISQIVNVEGLPIFSIKDSDVQQISSILEELSTTFDALDYKINEAYVKISLIGSGMRDMSGVASKAFITLIILIFHFIKQQKLVFLMLLMQKMEIKRLKFYTMLLIFKLKLK